MAYIMTTEVEIIQKAGNNASASFDTTMMTAANLRAESTINSATLYNWSDVYSTLNPDVKGVLSDYCSSFVAIEKISYDLDAIGRVEAEDRINVLRDGMIRAMGILRDTKVKGFIQDA